MRYSFFTLWRRLQKVRGAQAAMFLLPTAITFLVLSFLIRAGRLDEDDYEFTHAIQQFRHDPTQWFVPVLDNIAGLFTFLGGSLVLTPIVVIVAIFLWIRKRKHAAALSIVTLVGLPLNMLLKGIVGRPRPDRTLVEVLLPTVGLSYPSGHAMASTMVYGFLAALLWIHSGPNKLRRWGTVGAALLPLLISLSRIYVGAHFMSDVVGGMTAGLFCLVIMVKLYLHWTHEGPPPDPAKVAKNPMSPTTQRKVNAGEPTRV